VLGQRLDSIQPEYAVESTSKTMASIFTDEDGALHGLCKDSFYGVFENFYLFHGVGFDGVDERVDCFHRSHKINDLLIRDDLVADNLYISFVKGRQG